MSTQLQNIGFQSVKTTAQNVTDSWVDLGVEIVAFGYNKIGLWLDIDINDSNNIQIRALAKNSNINTTNEYALPIQTVGTSDVKVEKEYFEFNVDEDAKYLLEIDTGGHATEVQIQVKAGTVGGTAGQIESVYATKLWR